MGCQGASSALQRWVHGHGGTRVHGHCGPRSRPGVRLCQRNLLLLQKGFSASALPVLRNGDGRRQSQRFWVLAASVLSPWGCVWMSETLRISAALREKKGSLVRWNNCLWLSAEGGQLVCPSALFWAALGLFFVRWMMSTVLCYPEKQSDATENRGIQCRPLNVSPFLKVTAPHF